MVDPGDDLDELFKLPVAEFTAARNALSARLKKAGRGDEALRVKSLVKPPVSVWAVNQLYWKHREAFNELIEAGERLTRAQAAQLGGNSVDMRAALAGRREALSALSRLADGLLRDAGHSPAPETMRRITTTLEALSARASLSDNAPAAGRLTHDLDPPGFDSLAGLVPNPGRTERPVRSPVIAPRSSASAGKKASAKAALQAAERTLRETQTMAQDLASALARATAHADETEKDRREAEERFEKARVASGEARRRLHNATLEAQKAARMLQDAERRVEKARKDLKDQT